jgi:hypothetical protein
MALFGEEVHELLQATLFWIILHPTLPFPVPLGGDLPVEVLGGFIFINTPCGRALPPDNSARLQMKAGCIIIF